jgi:putative membrane-bound dehydrogenase-like protein
MWITTVFAENFNTPVTGVAAGIFAWRGDVYATIVPDLWKLRDTNQDGKADQREQLLTGFGIHIAYAGHDMHGVQLGPDGRIYWTIGDKAANVLSKEGKRWLKPYQGLLMRCNTDGTNFEIVAHGLRNVQQFAFDDFGNIFAVDNDADFSGEKERFLHIAEQSDTGWRMHYQYRGNLYNPWMRESLSVPSGAHQPAYITPTLSTYEDGPSGFARDPGTALNDRYRGYFFMTGFPKKKLFAFKTVAKGASFEMQDSHLVDQGRDFIGIKFGPDGALYAADWCGGYELDDKGAILKIDDPTQAKSSLRREVASMLKAGTKNIPYDELLKRLEHPDQRIRTDAHLELASTIGIATILTEAAAKLREKPIACTHALWALTKINYFSDALFEKLLQSSSEHTIAQTAKWAGETAGKPVPLLTKLLESPSAIVRYHAAIAIGRLGMSDSATAIFTLLEKNANADTRIRHAGIVALCGMSAEARAKALTHSSAAVRLAAAVVCRRLASPEVAALLADSDPAVIAEAAIAIHDDTGIAAARPALALLIEKNPRAPIPAILRSIAANRTIADQAAATRLTNYATNQRSPEEGRLAALAALEKWPTPITLDLVHGAWIATPAAAIDIAARAFSPAAPLLKKDPNQKIAKAAAATAKALGLFEDKETLVKIALDQKASTETRQQALLSLQSTAPDIFKSTALSFLKSDSPQLRTQAAKLLIKNDPTAVIDYAIRAAAKSTDVAERQSAIQLLATSTEKNAIQALEQLFSTAATAPEIQLELIEAAKTIPSVKNGADALQKSLATQGEIGAYLPSLHGGDATAGKQVFEGHLAAQCTACHRIGDEGSNVGPPLKGIGKKDRAYLLEALVLPQKSLAPGYGIMSITKKDGAVISGAMLKETPTAITLRLPTGEESTTQRSDIASKTDPISAMPPMGATLTPRELRDLVQYLSTL